METRIDTRILLNSGPNPMCGTGHIETMDTEKEELNKKTREFRVKPRFDEILAEN